MDESKNGVPLKGRVNSGGAPLSSNAQDSQGQNKLEVNLMSGPEGLSGPVSLDKASKLYNVSQKEVV